MASVRARAFTGLDLLMRRKAAGLRQQDVAEVMGVARTRISALEAMYRPPDPAVSRYLRAIEQAGQA